MIVNCYLLTVLCFLSAVEFSTPLRCYVCSTQLGVCGDPFNKSAHTADICDQATPVCLKEKFGAPGKIGSTHRSCVSKDHCHAKTQTTTHCSICTSDLCNSSIRPAANQEYFFYFLTIFVLLMRI